MEACGITRQTAASVQPCTGLCVNVKGREEESVLSWRYRSKLRDERKLRPILLSQPLFILVINQDIVVKTNVA